jgi:hypothetical protein
MTRALGANIIAARIAARMTLNLMLLCFAEILSRQLVKVAKAFVEKEVSHAQESVIYEIYTKAISELLDMNKRPLLSMYARLRN